MKKTFELKNIFRFLYLQLCLLSLFYYEIQAFADDVNPFDGDSNIDKSLPALSKILQFLGVILVKWLSPIAGAYLLFSGCWDGAHKSEEHGSKKLSWKDKVIFGGCMLAIRVLIQMFTTWLN